MVTNFVPQCDYSRYKPATTPAPTDPISTQPNVKKSPVQNTNNFEQSYSAASSAIYASRLGGIQYQSNKNKQLQPKPTSAESSLPNEMYNSMKTAKSAIISGDLESLIKSVNEMEKSDPAMASEHCLAMSLTKTVSPEQKEALLQKALTFDNKNEHAKYELAKQLTETGRKDEAKEMLASLKNEKGEIPEDKIIDLTDSHNLLAKEFNFEPTSTFDIKDAINKINQQ